QPPVPAAGPKRRAAGRPAAHRSAAGAGHRGAVSLSGRGAPRGRRGAAAHPAARTAARVSRGDVPRSAPRHTRHAGRLAGHAVRRSRLLDERARVVHQNPAFRELLAEEPEAARLERECVHAGRRLLALAAPNHAKSRPEEIIGPGATALRTATAVYQLRTALVGPGVLGLGPMALVVLERRTPGRRALEGFRVRF